LPAERAALATMAEIQVRQVPLGREDPERLEIMTLPAEVAEVVIMAAAAEVARRVAMVWEAEAEGAVPRMQADLFFSVIQPTQDSRPVTAL
jgi:hypothetical protein